MIPWTNHIVQDFFHSVEMGWHQFLFLMSIKENEIENYFISVMDLYQVNNAFII